MDSSSSTLQSLKTPIKVLFVVGNGLVWIVFSVTLILHWGLVPANSRWSGILLAISFFSLGWSLLKRNDQSLTRCTLR
jgi:hypothetical protein